MGTEMICYQRLIMLVLRVMMIRSRHTSESGLQFFIWRRHSDTDSGIWYRNRHSDTDSGILIQIQAFWYRFRHLLQIQALATDSDILIQNQASWYRFTHSDTDPFFMCYIWYRIMQSNTRTCNLIQNHAICYIDMQSAT